MPSTPALSPVKTAVRALADKIADLDSFANDPSDPRFKAALDQASKLWEQLRNVLNKSQTRTIAEFFDAVGSSIVEAQGRLDKASEAYVRSTLRRDPGITGVAPGSNDSAAAPEGGAALGTLFRIPRVTAELKCSLEMDREKGFNVIFYTDRTDVRELHQQTVHLEVVAVPVPPDYLNYLKSQPTTRSEGTTQNTTGAQALVLSASDYENMESAEGPLSFSDGAAAESDPPMSPGETQQQQPAELRRPSIATYLQERVTDYAEHAELRSLVEKLAKKQRRAGGQRHSSIRKYLLPAWSKALVLTDRSNTRFILLATTDKRPRLWLWQLGLRPASLRLLYSLPSQKKALRELSHIQKFLSELGASQAALAPS